MRTLVVGAGGVGSAIAVAAARRGFFEQMVLADVDESRARRAVDAVADKRFTAARVDASSAADVAALAAEHRVDTIVNACDPRFNPGIFHGAFEAGCTYLDMAMTLSQPHPQRPYEECGVKLGDDQFALADEWERRGLLALCGLGIEPGFADVVARYASDHLFTTIDEVAVRDGADLTIDGYDFAPTFSIWTVIEECLNPPVVWERDRGWYCVAPFSEPEIFRFPDGIGNVECVHVEHEEVVLVPRWVDCNKVTFKYGLGDEFIAVLSTLHKLGLDNKDAIDVAGARVAPRDVVAACLPDPATLGDKMHGKTCAGTYVTGTGTDGNRRAVYLYHVSDNEETMARHGCQAVVWQTAINPVFAMELLAEGTWSGAGVLGPEAFDSVPYLDLMNDSDEPWHLDERAPA